MPTSKTRPKGRRNSGSAKAIQAGATAQDERTGQFKSGSGLTSQQREFVRRFVRNGGQARAAAIESGYSAERVRQSVAELMATPKIRTEIKRESERYVASNLQTKALGTMERLLDDESTPHNVQFQAAKWVMETSGIGGSGNAQGAENPDEKPLDEWSINELQAFIDGGQQALADRRDQEARTIDVTPDSAQDSAQSDPGDGLTD